MKKIEIKTVIMDLWLFKKSTSPEWLNNQS